jgi:hypothetical protein
MSLRRSKSEKKVYTFRPQVMRLEDRLVPGEVLGTALSWAMGPLAGAVLMAQESSPDVSSDNNTISLAATATSSSYDDSSSLTVCQYDGDSSSPGDSAAVVPAASTTDVPVSTQTNDQVFSTAPMDLLGDADTSSGGAIPTARMNFGALWSPSDLSPGAEASGGGAAAVAPVVGNTAGILLGGASGAAGGASTMNVAAADSAASDGTTAVAFTPTITATAQAAATTPARASVLTTAAVQPSSTTTLSGAAAADSAGSNGDSGPVATPLLHLGHFFAAPNQKAPKPNAANGAPPFSPQQLAQTYGFNQVSNQGAGQTIYIVDAFNDPNITSDLATFDSGGGFFSAIPAPPSFTVHKMSGHIRNSTSWGLEESLDVEWAHAMAPQANIVLVEAATNSFSNLYAAVDWATNNGAHIVSMSWGGGDASGESSNDSHFNHSGVTYIASSGDSGGVVEYPSASPYVLSVGGTSLTLNTNNSYASESAWSSGGGGASVGESEPGYQTSYGISLSGRGTPDVAYNADPNTGVYVYDSFENPPGWYEVGGTSAGAPQWASIIALADQSRSTPLSTNNLTSRTEYNAATGSVYASNYHDITTGSNGHPAGPGYDLATGVGSPQVNNLVPWLIANN